MIRSTGVRRSCEILRRSDLASPRRAVAAASLLAHIRVYSVYPIRINLGQGKQANVVEPDTGSLDAGARSSLLSFSRLPAARLDSNGR